MGYSRKHVSPMKKISPVKKISPKIDYYSLSRNELILECRTRLNENRKGRIRNCSGGTRNNLISKLEEDDRQMELSMRGVKKSPSYSRKQVSPGKTLFPVKLKRGRPKLDLIEKTKRRKINRLFHAVFLGDIKIVEKILDEGIDVNITNKDGITPLITAVKNGYTNIVKLLIEKGANVNVKDNNGDPIILLATSSNNIGVDILRLLIENGANVNVTSNDEYFRTPLTSALSGHRKEMAELLINNGADIELASMNDSRPLQYAVLFDIDIVDLLIKKGVDVNKFDYYGWTALMKASHFGKKDIVYLLLQNGAEINIKNKHGDTALTFASKEGYDDIAELLIKNGADISVLSKKDQRKYSKYIIESKSKII
jgi:ankyrin repeat protein